MRCGIVGVGEPMAGDDGAGLRVIERLRRAGTLPNVELYELRDASELASLLQGWDRALVVDALLEPALAGRVDVVDFELLAREHPPAERRAALRRPLSSHGIDTLTALELGKALASAGGFPAVSLLTISIARPEVLATELSEVTDRAVDEAVSRALAWARESPHA